LHADVYDDESVDVLQAAADIIGFPYPLQPAASGRLFDVGVDISIRDGESFVEWEYMVVTAEAPEFALDNIGRPAGPATDLIVDTYADAWTELGLEPQNWAWQNDPDEVGGIRTAQLYFRADTPLPLTTPLGDGGLIRLGAGAYDDYDFADAIAGETPQPGYWHRVDATFPGSVVPVPAIVAVLDATPTHESMRLTGARFATRLQDEDSPFSEFGSRALSMRIEFEAPVEAFADVMAMYVAAPFDPDVIRYARVDVTDGVATAIDDELDPTADFKRVDLLLDGRHVGSLRIETPDIDDETFDIDVSFSFEPDRPAAGSE